MPQHLMCTDRAVIAAYGLAEERYFTWLDDVTDGVRDLGIDPASVRAFYSFDGFTTVQVPVVEPVPAGWAVDPAGPALRPAAGAVGAAGGAGGVPAWMAGGGTRPEPIRALVEHGLPALAFTPGRCGVRGSFSRPAEHVFDDVVVVTTGDAHRFHREAGALWSPIPRALLDAILVEHGVPPAAAA